MSTKIEHLTKKVADAKNTAAIGAEFAEDYIIIKGVKFYHQTVSHAWVIPMAVARLGDKLSVFDKGMVSMYLLANSPEDVRNKCMQELRKGVLYERAMNFFIEHEITPADLEAADLETLLQHPYEKNA